MDTDSFIIQIKTEYFHKDIGLIPRVLKKLKKQKVSNKTKTQI